MGDIIVEEESMTTPVRRLCRQQLILDDELSRITFFDFGPGEENEVHFHPYDFVVVTFDDGLLESLATDGVTAKIPAKANNYYKVPAGNRHRAKNIGDKSLRLLEIEIKSTDIRKQIVGDGRQAVAQKASVADVIRACEKARQEAMGNRDIPALDELLLDALSYTHADGVHDSKSSYLEKIKSGALVYHEISLDEIEVYQASSDTVLTTGISRGAVTVDGARRNTAVRFTILGCAPREPGNSHRFIYRTRLA